MAIDWYKGLPVFKLRSLSGQPLKQGDSGGGVWFRGQLVGNTWATLLTSSGAEKTTAIGSEVESRPAYTDISIAAMLPKQR
jgi:hypothetical protein